MKCARCGHENISEFRFCELCLAPLEISGTGRSDDVVGRFFDEADLLESSPSHSSRGMALPTRVELPWFEQQEEMEVLGRDEELDDLTARVEAALDTRRGQAIAVVGETGSGRSRLLAATRDRVRARQVGARFLVCSAQGTHRPFSLIERMLRLRFDIPDYLGGTIAGERFERAGEALFGDHTGAEVARTCGPMLGFHFWSEHDIDFETRHEQTRRAREALTTLWLRDLAELPTVVVIDDAGETDVESLDFIAQLMTEVREISVVFLIAFDESGRKRHPWLGEIKSVELSPMGSHALTDLAKRALKGVEGVDSRVISTLVDNADGRPGALLGALESAVQAGGVVQKGDRWVLDGNLLITLIHKGRLRTERGGRFDELSDDELEVARLGAVFGVRFWLGGITALLREVAGGARTLADFGQDGLPARVLEGCASMAERGLLVREPSDLLAYEVVYRFVEEADVAKLLELHDPEQLKRLSYRAAVWLDLVGRHRARELASVRAPLWLAAGDINHAAYLYLHAGELAFEELQHDVARGFLQKALELAPDSTSSVHIFGLLELGGLAEFDGRAEEAEGLYRDVLGFAWTYRARGMGAQALFRLGRLFRTRGKVNLALEHLVPALKLYEAVGDLKGLAATCDDVGRCYWLAGNMKPALRFLQRAAKLRERLGDKHGLANTLTNMGVLAMSAGQNETARRHIARAIELRREAQKVHGLVESLNVLGILMMNTGEMEAALTAMEEAYDLSKRVGNRRLQATLQNNLGEVLLRNSRLEEAEALLYKAVEGAGRIDDHNLLSDAARNLALAARERNDHERATKWARRSVAATQLSDVSRVRAAAMETLGEILADGDDHDAADSAFRRAAQLWTEANDRGALIACLQIHAAFLMRVDRVSSVEPLLKRVDKLQRGARKRDGAASITSP